MKRMIKWVAVLLVVAVALLLAVTGPADTTPYADTPEYKETMANLAAVKPWNNAGDQLRVGWARVNLSPSFTTPMATSEARQGKHFTMVEDSIYVRAFVFDNGTTRAAFVTADLLIIPPTVTKLLFDKEKDLGLQGRVFYTATHTHSSIGGWAPGYVGGRFAGEYDEQVVQFIADKIGEALKLAGADMQPATIGFGKMGTYKAVENRLVGNKGTVDDQLRLIRINRADGSGAAIVSFAAHATCLPDTLMHLHRDYPGLLVSYLEREQPIDIAAFAAGAMGSMGPGLTELGPWLGSEQLAADLYYASLQMWNRLEMDTVSTLYMDRFTVKLRDPNYRVANGWRIRPWVFRQLFGEGDDTYISCLRLGDILLVGTPCDFSGELVAPIDALAKAQGRNLMITSFNGDYCGYITHDKWYNMDTYETRTMNWFGPGTGAYFSEVIDSLVIKF